MISADIPTYKDALARLYSLERWGIKLGLDNIRDFASHLGNPQDKLPAIHVAGTNGKGTVTAILDAVLRAAGYTVGRYTSPHLRDFRERIYVNGAPISRARVQRFVGRHWSTIHARRYSYFETVTAMAYDAFADAGCDIAVHEVGLGGRFDATNILDPAVTVITHIDFDHERTLGRTLRQIAREKAGIIKPGTPLLVGALPADAHAAIERVATRIGSPLFTATQVFTDYERARNHALARLRFRFPLLGAHQARNLRVALACLLLVEASGIPVPVNALTRGVQAVRWPARFHVDPGRPTIVYDVAHNPSGMRAFVDTWRAVFPKRRAVVVFTTREDKRYRDMWRDLSSVTQAWIGCPLPHSEGIDRDTMTALANRAGVPFEWADSAVDAMRQARRKCGPEDILAVVGSHYLVGEIIPAGLCAPNAPQWRHEVIPGTALLRG